MTKNKNQRIIIPFIFSYSFQDVLRPSFQRSGLHHSRQDEHSYRGTQHHGGVSGSVVKWLATDAQNSASLEVDRVSGAVTRRYTDPFGNTRGTAAPW